MGHTPKLWMLYLCSFNVKNELSSVLEALLFLKVKSWGSSLRFVLKPAATEIVVIVRNFSYRNLFTEAENIFRHLSTWTNCVPWGEPAYLLTNPYCGGQGQSTNSHLSKSKLLRCFPRYFLPPKVSFFLVRVDRYISKNYWAVIPPPHFYFLRIDWVRASLPFALNGNLPILTGVSETHRMGIQRLHVNCYLRLLISKVQHSRSLCC